MILKQNINLTQFHPNYPRGAETQQRIIEKDKVEKFDKLINQLYSDGITINQLDDILNERSYVFEQLGIKEEDEEKIQYPEYYKEFDLTNKEDLNYLTDINVDIPSSGREGNFVSDLFHVSEKFEIPYEDVQIMTDTEQDEYGNWDGYDINIDFDYELDGYDVSDHFTDDDFKKYILELAGSDTKISPIKLVKRSTIERLIKFVKENNIFSEDEIETAAQDYYDSGKYDRDNYPD